MRRLRCLLRERGVDKRQDHLTLALVRERESVAHEVHSTALPRRGKDLRDRRLEAEMRIRNHEFHATESAPREIAQELQPERFGFARANCNTKDFPYTVNVYRDGDYHRDGYYAAGLPDFHVRRIDPKIRPIAFQRAREKCVNPLVDLTAKPRHLALRDPRHAHRSDQIVDRSRRDALDIRFLNHCCKRFFSGPTWLEQRWEV